jgi:hypothetical protein
MSGEDDNVVQDDMLPADLAACLPCSEQPRKLVLLIDGVDEADGRAGALDNNIMRYFAALQEFSSRGLCQLVSACCVILHEAG